MPQANWQFSAANASRLASFGPYADGGIASPGKYAYNFLSTPGDFEAGDTVTIGTNVFKVTVLATDSTRTCSLADDEDISLLTASGAVTAEAGYLLGLSTTEIVKILRKISTTVFVVARGRCGTSPAVHAGSAIYTASAAQTDIPVGTLGTLTPTVMIPAFVEEINNAKAGGERATALASTIFDPGTTATDAQRAGKVVAFARGTAGLIVRSAIPEVSVLATTEVGTNVVWTRGATLTGGAVPAIKRVHLAAIVPSAADVTAGLIVIPVPFTPGFVNVTSRVTASGVPGIWLGGVTVDSTNKVVIIDNTTSEDWAATDTLYVMIAEA